MCRSKESGGRRCGESSTPEYRAAYRARRKAERLAEAVVQGITSPANQGHHETGDLASAPMPQAVADAAAYDARVAYYAALDIPDTEARDWADLPIEPDEGTEWALEGFTAAEAADWRDADIDPAVARQWLETGLPIEEALEWSALYFDPQVASDWRAAGFKANDPVFWMYEGFTPERAREWEHAGVDTGCVARGWEQHGFSPAQAREWISAGQGCAEAAGAYVGALPQVARPHALSAFQCGYTPEQAAGLDWDDPQVVDGLRTIGALRSGVFPSSPAA